MMEPCVIRGMGILSRRACSPEELAGVLDQPASGEFPTKVAYEPTVPAAKLRRCSGYVKLAVEAATRAAQDGGLSQEEDPYQVGTIFSSGYGAAESNLQFSDSVAKGNPALCSPAVFSGTVPNSCVGQVCIVGGYRGPSTLLMGGDPLEFTSLLLQRKKARQILCGSVEACSPQLWDSLGREEAAQGMDLAEGAVVLTVSREGSFPAYCKVTAFGSASFSQFPYVHRISPEEGEQVLSLALDPLQGVTPDAVLDCANGTYFDTMEQRALESRFPRSRRISPKKWLGETLGSGYLMNVALGAALLRRGKEGYRSLLATGVDTAGNYLWALLEVL